MRKATPSDKATIINILAPAFDANKSINYIVKQDDNRKERIRMLMDYSFNMCNKFGEIWISDDQKACALIMFNDLKRPSLSALLWDVKLSLFVVGLSRLKSILKREAMIKSNHPKEPIAYLLFFGVDTTVQGKGVGSSLLKEVIRECDRKGRAIYLETSMDRNLPFYKKSGFEIFETLQLSYTLYLLRREVSR